LCLPCFCTATQELLYYIHPKMSTPFQHLFYFSTQFTQRHTNTSYSRFFICYFIDFFVFIINFLLIYVLQCIIYVFFIVNFHNYISRLFIMLSRVWDTTRIN